MSSIAVTPDFTEQDISNAGLYGIVPDFPEGPPTSTDILDLTGQTAGASDPSGINGTYPGTPPYMNPNPTGGWQNSLLNIARIGLLGLQTYENGSVSSATPRALRPATATTIAPSNAAASAGIGVNLSTILFIGAGVILGGVLIHQMTH